MRSATVSDVLGRRLFAGAVREGMTFDGPAGRLRGELAYPEAGTPAFATLIVGPHPYMGGTMSNPLVAAIASRLVENNGIVLRFDYGGTGRSEGPPIDVAESMAVFWRTGHAPEDADRIEDVAAAAEYIGSLGVKPFVIVGYSFGCHAALRGLPETKPAAAVLVSPTVARHDFSDVNGWGTPMMVIHSDDDFATPVEAAREWFDTVPEPKRRCCIEGGEHFFRGSESRVADLCSEFVVSSVGCCSWERRLA